MSSNVEARDESANWRRVLALSSRLSNPEKLRLIAHLADQLEPQLSSESKQKSSKCSLLGALANLGAAPSDNDFAEARQEMARNFPREDICS